MIKKELFASLHEQQDVPNLVRDFMSQVTSSFQNKFNIPKPKVQITNEKDMNEYLWGFNSTRYDREALFQTFQSYNNIFSEVLKVGEVWGKYQSLKDAFLKLSDQWKLYHDLPMTDCYLNLQKKGITFNFYYYNPDDNRFEEEKVVPNSERSAIQNQINIGVDSRMQAEPSQFEEPRETNGNDCQQMQAEGQEPNPMIKIHRFALKAKKNIKKIEEMTFLLIQASGFKKNCYDKDRNDDNQCFQEKQKIDENEALKEKGWNINDTQSTDGRSRLNEGGSLIQGSGSKKLCCEEDRHHDHLRKYFLVCSLLFFLLISPGFYMLYMHNRKDSDPYSLENLARTKQYWNYTANNQETWAYVDKNFPVILHWFLEKSMLELLPYVSDIAYYLLGTNLSYSKQLSQIVEKEMKESCTEEQLCVGQLARHYLRTGILYTKQMDFAATPEEKKSNFSLAEDYYSKSLAIYEHFDADYEKGWITNNIGVIHLNMAKYDHALLYFKESSSVFARLKGKESSEVGMIANNIGLIYIYQGQLLNGLSFLFRSKDACLPKHHRIIVFDSLGKAFENISKSESIKYYQQSRNLAIEVYGNNHSVVVEQNLQLANAYMRDKQYLNAKETAEENKKINVFPDDHFSHI